MYNYIYLLFIMELLKNKVMIKFKVLEYLLKLNRINLNKKKHV